jgi:transcriptional regulator with XRE-family HTH domain
MPSTRASVLVAFGAAVRSLRQARGWSQEDFADRIGIHRTYVGSIERGEQNVCLINIAKIADALGVPVSTLLAAAERQPALG